MRRSLYQHRLLFPPAIPRVALFYAVASSLRMASQSTACCGLTAEQIIAFFLSRLA